MNLAHVLKLLADEARAAMASLADATPVRSKAQTLRALSDLFQGVGICKLLVDADVPKALGVQKPWGSGLAFCSLPVLIGNNSTHTRHGQAEFRTEVTHGNARHLVGTPQGFIPSWGICQPLRQI